MRNILVTGGTGFTGSRVVRLLTGRYGKATCFIRPSSDRTVIELPGVEFVEGDLDDDASFRAALGGKDALIHVANLMGSTKDGGKRARMVVTACADAGVNRAVFVSSASIFTKMKADTKAARLAAEEAVRMSGLDFTILRPTMIYGGRRDRNMTRLIEFLRRSPIIPIPGDGNSLTQPIHVDDLAFAVVECLETKTSIGRIYTLSGASPLTFNEVIDQTCAAIGVTRLKIHIPLRLAFALLRYFRRVPKRLRITEEQLQRLNENKVFDYTEARSDFGFNPRTFAEGIMQEVSGDRMTTSRRFARTVDRGTF
jgi:nucleoside-diphosphate-sugar epimerase